MAVVQKILDKYFPEEREPIPQHDHEPVEAGAPCRVCGVPEKEHE
jgi:hypothetical protein